MQTLAKKMAYSLLVKNVAIQGGKRNPSKSTLKAQRNALNVSNIRLTTCSTLTKARQMVTITNVSSANIISGASIKKQRK
jgi:hypothetical protein